ncbi:flagellar hook-associated protein FlgK [Cytobacillus sp. FJAT-54145]|uniref:Flagellar hook-associated protein 1 n=1 Tax=Cytobacillus spartinae TaxID=3299023 RepID=A0ABW6KD40_9BACI
MVSTFYGLEVARRGMMTQQAALHTTGQNIANANTPGYTRQRVNFVQTTPYPTPSLNRAQIPGQMGTGVQAGSIQRVRDHFIDDQYRGENNKLGYWGTRSQALNSLETIMNEPTDEGLANSLDQFWTALQDLSVTPRDSGARSVVRQRGVAVADTFNYIYGNLKAVKEDYKNEIAVSQKAINSLLNQINKVNQQIGEVEVHGYVPNDLYDQRDRLVDDLSEYVNVKIEAKPSGGMANSVAEGKYDVYLANNNGQIMTDDAGNKIKLVDATTREAFGVSLAYSTSHSDNPIEGLKLFKLHPDGDGYGGFIDDPTNPSSVPAYSVASFQSFRDQTSGSFTAMIEAYGYTSGTSVKGLYSDMMRNLDEMAFTFAQQFNNIHRSGWSISEINAGIKNGKEFFSFDSSVATPTSSNPTGAAASLRLSSSIEESLNNIAAAAAGTFISHDMNGDITNTTVGSPEIKGNVEFPTGATQLEVEVTWTGSKWTYKVAPGQNGATEQTGDLLLQDSVAEIPNFPGLKIDFSTISTPVSNDKWSYTVQNNGGISPKDEAFLGSGSNAAALANVKDEILKYGSSNTSVTGFYQSVIGDMGVKASQANQMSKNTGVLREAVLTRRESVSSVSLDEEMTNLITFQHAYNAAARNITMVDEMLDRVINNMGLVGR